MGAMADMMRQNPAMAEQMRSMMQNMDPEQFKSMVRACGCMYTAAAAEHL